MRFLNSHKRDGSDRRLGGPQWRRSSGFTAVEFLLVGTMIMVLVALLMPVLQQSREAARRIQCLNNLNQIGIALQNYEAIMGVLPPGCVNPAGPVLNEPSGYHMSWAAQVLPNLDQRNLFETLDWTYGAYSVFGTGGGQLQVSTFMCGADPEISNSSASSYAGSIGGSSRVIDSDNSGLLYLNSSVRDFEITDGRSNTLVVGEKRVSPILKLRGLGWASGTAATLRSTGIPLNSTDEGQYELISGEAGGFGSWHEGMASVLFADGAARAMNDQTDVDVLVRLGDRSDGELINRPDAAADRRTGDLRARPSGKHQEALP